MFALARGRIVVKLTIMGIDPGSTNAGIAVIRIKIKKDRVRVYVKRCGKLKNLLKDLKLPHKKELQRHVNEIREVVKEFQVDFILAERYMARGGKGATIEYVNQMLGAVEYGIKQEVTQIPAATWKNRVNKVFDLNQFYKDCYRVEPHEIDAIFQAFWLAEKKMNLDLIGYFESEKIRDKLIQVILCQTTSTLKKERKKK